MLYPKFVKRKIVLELFILILAAFFIIAVASYFDFSLVKTELPPEPKVEYGIVVDSMAIYKSTIKPGQVLSKLLGEYGVNATVIDQLAKKSDTVFNLRKIRAGNRYTILCKNDSSQTLQYLIYEIDPVSFVVFDFRDSLRVYSGDKEVTTVTRVVHNSIKTSLWNSIVENEANPELAVNLSDIYAWTIDFYGIQKNDHYKVIYDEMFVEGKSIGIGRIKAALFNSGGKDFYAFFYTQDSIGQYFDEEGKSLRRAFLKAPLKFRRISSKFTNSRFHPVLKIRRPHHGVDYAASYGTPVYTIGDGVVIMAGWSTGGGKTVKIKHNSVYVTSYMHLAGFAPGLRSGKRLKQGDLIGYVGSTGLSTGPHLDFRVYKNGSPTDPLKMESPPTDPVHSSLMEDYKSRISNLKTTLDQIK